MNYRLGAARALYARHAHPRLLLGPTDLVRLRRQIRTGPGRVLMDALRRQVRPWVDTVLKEPALPAAIAARKPAVSWTCGKCVFPLDHVAAVAVLDRDAEATEAVVRFLLALPQAGCVPHGDGQLGYSITGHVPLGYDLIAAVVSPEALRPYTLWAVEQCVRRTLAEVRPFYLKGAGVNIPLVAVCGIALLGALGLQGDPGVPDLKAELSILRRYLEASLYTALGPQGYPVEDIGYGTSVLPVLVQAVEAVRRAGLWDAYAAVPRLKRAGAAILQFVQPWGDALANTGDCTGMFPFRGFTLARLAAETRDPALRWLLNTLGHPGQPPLAHDPTFFEDVRPCRDLTIPSEWTSLLALDDVRTPVHPARADTPTRFRDETRGLVAWRSGWRADDTFLIFDGGRHSPSVPGHMHASGGHFGLSALGEYFAIDTGRYSSEQSEHNVVLVDGRSGRSLDRQWGMSFYHGNLIAYRPGAVCDFAAADSSMQHDCYWARRAIGLVRAPGAPAYVWMVEDINKANDYREFWWTLNTHYNNTIETDGTRAVIHGCRHGHGLDVHFVLPPPDRYPKPHTLTVTQDVNRCQATRYIPDMDAYAERMKRADGYYPPEHVVVVRPRLIGKVAGYNGRFMTLLLPRRRDEPPATVTPLPTLDNALAARIAWPGVTDTLVWAYEHRLLEADGVSARGQWCLTRRARRTGRVLAHAVDTGEQAPSGI